MILSQNTIGFINDMIKESGVDYAKKTFEDLQQQAKIKISNIPDFDSERIERHKTFLINYTNTLSYIIRYKRELILKQLMSL